MTETTAPIYYTPPADPIVLPTHWPRENPIRYQLTEKGKAAQ